MKTLCLGGSFNPIHHGHLICARSVAETLGYEQILLIPSGQPPHKTGDMELAPADDRLKMAVLAVSAHNNASQGTHPIFDVSDVELTQIGPSFTIGTARILKRKGFSEVHWLIGADMLNYLPNWHEAATLIREVKFVIIGRPGTEFAWDSLPEDFAVLKSNVVAAPRIDISATDIRRRVRAGLSIDFLTPAPVVEYIRSRRLWKS